MIRFIFLNRNWLAFAQKATYCFLMKSPIPESDFQRSSIMCPYFSFLAWSFTIFLFMYQMPLKLGYLLFSEHAPGFFASCCLAHVATKWIRISFNHPCQNSTNPSRVSSAVFCLTEAFLNCSLSLLSLPPKVAFCISERVLLNLWSFLLWQLCADWKHSYLYRQLIPITRL